MSVKKQEQHVYVILKIRQFDFFPFLPISVPVNIEMNGGVIRKWILDKKTQEIHSISFYIYIYKYVYINEHIDEQKASPHERSSDRKNREKKKYEGKNDAVCIGRDDLIIL
jgi:hypothetical protein